MDTQGGANLPHYGDFSFGNPFPELCTDELCLVRGAAVHNRQFYFMIASSLLRKGLDFVDGLHPSKRLPDRIIDPICIAGDHRL